MIPISKKTVKHRFCMPLFLCFSASLLLCFSVTLLLCYFVPLFLCPFSTFVNFVPLFLCAKTQCFSEMRICAIALLSPFSTLKKTPKTDLKRTENEKKREKTEKNSRCSLPKWQQVIICIKISYLIYPA